MGSSTSGSSSVLLLRNEAIVPKVIKPAAANHMLQPWGRRNEGRVGGGTSAACDNARCPEDPASGSKGVISGCVGRSAGNQLACSERLQTSSTIPWFSSQSARASPSLRAL